MKLYHVWFVPTQRGIDSFGWHEKICTAKPLLLEDAQFACYEMGLEESSPDAALFGKYEIREEV